MRAGVLAACLLCLCVAQSSPGLDDCDDGRPLVKFADLRAMEDEKIDFSPFLDVPVDHEIGRALPMVPSKSGIDTVCPFGVPCPPPPKPPKAPKPPTPQPTPKPPSTNAHPDAKPKSADEIKRSDKTAMDKPSNDVTPPNTDALDPSSSPRDILFPKETEKEPEPTEVVEESEEEMESTPEPLPEPIGVGPDGLTLASRVEGSEVEKHILEQKKREFEEAVQRAKEAAVAASPSPAPPPDQVVEEEVPPTEVVGLGDPEPAGPGMGPPELPEPSQEPRIPPEASVTPSTTPSPSPSASSPFQQTIETEFDDDCEDTPPLVEATDASGGDMPRVGTAIDRLRGQQLPEQHQVRVDSDTTPELQAFEQLPTSPQETRVDPDQISPLVPTSTDDNMLDLSKYQTFSLHGKEYAPKPGTRYSMRKMNLAGDDMGTYEPTLEMLDQVKAATSKLAGAILGRDSPLKTSETPEEFRANELSLNVTWALMNDPTKPSPSPEPLAHVAPPPRNLTVPLNVTAPRPLVNSTQLRLLREMFSRNNSFEMERPPTPSPNAAPAEHEEPEAEPEIEAEPEPEREAQYSDKYHESEANVLPPHVVVFVPGAMPEPDTPNVNDNMEQNAANVPQVPDESKFTYLGDSSRVVRNQGISHQDVHGNAMPHSNKAMEGLGGAVEEACDDDKVLSPSEGISLERATMVPIESCQSRSSCDRCVGSAGCVWCPTMNACVDGSEDGPTAVHACVRDFVFGKCEAGTWA